MKIVIVGAGIISLYHLLAYSKVKIKDIKLAYIVEPNKEKMTKWFQEFKKLFPKSDLPKWVPSIEDIGDLSEYVLDICSPNHTHFEYIVSAEKKNCSNIIVEKPAVIKKEEVDKIVGLNTNLFIQENYIYSPVLKKVVMILNETGLMIDSIFFNFSKNRTKDSLNKRGFINNTPPHVFWIEMPHSMGIANYLLGSPKIIYTEAHDMLLPDSKFEMHGSGTIISSHSGIITHHYSNLQSNNRVRKMILNGKSIDGDNYRIEANFAKSANDLNGNIKIFIEDTMLKELRIEDDSLTKSLSEILFSIQNNKYKNSPVNKDFIISTMRALIKAIDHVNTNSYKGEKRLV